MSPMKTLGTLLNSVGDLLVMFDTIFSSFDGT